MSTTDLEPIVDPVLTLLADIVDDLENTRKANGNRFDHLTRSTEDSDGRVRGLGFDEDSPEVAHLVSINEGLADVEKQAIKDLEKRMKKHPLESWLSKSEQKGAGNKQVARLLASIGDPYVHTWIDDDKNVHNDARTVGQLWAYCGHGDPSLRRYKGMKQTEAFKLGNATAKMRVWNVAGSLVKSGVRKDDDAPTNFTPDTRTAITPWGQIYIDRRIQTWDRVHAVECVRCGPSGKPAQPGSPWSNAHQEADAKRVLGKEFLKALWIESRRLHGVQD